MLLQLIHRRWYRYHSTTTRRHARPIRYHHTAGRGSRRPARCRRRSRRLVSPSGGRRSLSACSSGSPRTPRPARRRRSGTTAHTPHLSNGPTVDLRRRRRAASSSSRRATAARTRPAAGQRDLGRRARSRATRAARPDAGEEAERVHRQDRERGPERQVALVEVHGQHDDLPLGPVDRRAKSGSPVDGAGQHLRLAGGRRERQLAGLGHQHVVEPDVGHQRRVLVLLRHDRVLQLLADLPEVAVVRSAR